MTHQIALLGRPISLSGSEMYIYIYNEQKHMHFWQFSMVDNHDRLNGVSKFKPCYEKKWKNEKHCKGAYFGMEILMCTKNYISP